MRDILLPKGCVQIMLHTAYYIFYEIDIGVLPTPIHRCFGMLRCCRFSMSDVYISRTLRVISFNFGKWVIVSRKWC